MAREAAKVARFKMPKDLPAGLEIVEAERTVSGPAVEVEGKKVTPSVKAVVSYLVPCMTGEGIQNYIAFRSSHLEEDSVNGVAFAAAAIRSAILSGVTAQLTPDTLADSRTIFPPVSDVRVVDKEAVAGDRLSAFLRDNSRAPNDKELAEILSGLAG